MAWRQRHYILNEAGEPEPTEDLVAWVWWCATHDEQRRLAVAELPGGVEVSTIFTGIDSGWGSGAPVLWETMVFGLTGEIRQWRYRSRQDAERGHGRIVAALQRGEEV